jgi:hypothetical protein
MLLGSKCWGLENQIINGEFDAGIEPWQRSPGDGYTIDVVQDVGLSGLNALKIDISDANAQESIMITHGGLVLENGATYHIGFTAKADADRQMGVLLELDGSWVYAWHEWIDLNPLPQTFHFEYIHTRGTTENVVLYFILKHSLFPLLNENENIDAYIDGVYVVQEPPADPNLAHYPWPPDGAIHEDTWICCSWTPGQYAFTHDVYFSNNFDDVYNGTDEAFKGNLYDFFWITGFPDYAYSPGLIPGTTYYWRVDEVNDMHPDSPWKGDVWSFWLPPRTSYAPYPSDGAELIDPNVTLGWEALTYASSHNVYLGENAVDVENGIGGTFKGNFSTTSYLPDCLDFETTYYWRVDVVYSWGAYEKGDVWRFSTKPAGPNIAHEPNPPDGAIYTDTWPVFSWSPGRHAVSHDVYFGENYDDVYNGTENTFLGNQNISFWTIGFLSFPDPSFFVPGTTYYWRVDEVNNMHPDSPWKGDVWSFGIPPYTTYDPVPADGAVQIDPYVTLNWKAGFGAKSHTIYFGDNFDDVNDATAGIPHETTTYIPGPLEFGKTYYWRVDELSPSGIYKGKVWSFSTKPAGLNTAYDPYPADGVELIDPNVTLSWEAGFGAKLHVLYLGENSAEVEAGTGGTFKGIFSETSYLPDHLENGKTYYWRVDEFDVTTTHKGEIWSFNIASAELVRGSGENNQ